MSKLEAAGGKKKKEEEEEEEEEEEIVFFSTFGHRIFQVWSPSHRVSGGGSDQIARTGRKRYRQDWGMLVRMPWQSKAKPEEKKQKKTGK